MPVELKSRREIEMMRQAGAVAHRILAVMKAATIAGNTTSQLDEIARQELEKAGARAMSKNYPTYKPGEGFPGYTCISINEEVVHGIPGPRVLKDGDIVKLDIALSLNGYCADTAITVAVGKIASKLQSLLDVTRQTLDLALENIKPGKKWSDIARLMQWNVERHGFSVVREFVGHGVGRSMHEDPKVPNFVTPEQLRSDFKLKVGMTFAVEPMVVMGHRDVILLDDQWTVITEDRMPAAHFEHTIAVTETGVDILTNGIRSASNVSAAV
jgi:methionyl aminopeptidase